MASLVAFRLNHRCEGNDRSKQRQRAVTQPECAPAKCVEALSSAYIGERAGPLSHYGVPGHTKRRYVALVGWNGEVRIQGSLGDGNK
jgi:hypothetical protein